MYIINNNGIVNIIIYTVTHIKTFSDEDIDECHQNVKLQKLSNDFKKSDESDDDIMVCKM